jgi:glycosyltransferase involved in cell wall biosynthesis
MAVKYGAARALLEVARAWQDGGRSVVLVGLSSSRSGSTEGIPFIGAPDEESLLRMLPRLEPCQVLVGCSRADVFLHLPAASRLVYHHGPHLPEGELALPLIKRLRIPVAVVSEDSLRFQRRHTLPAQQLHLVRNGYNHAAFQPPVHASRHPHRIVFAGLGVRYKGLDIAIHAFSLLRTSFPDAEFDIFGATPFWNCKADACYLRGGWLTSAGQIDWHAVESDLPGLRFRGAVSSSELARAFQGASILVMPSRVHETFGIVSVEAQACGCIPVLPNQGGFPETMLSERTGFVYEPNTPEALAARIEGLWRTGRPTVDQRSFASRWVAGQFSWGAAAAQLSALVAPAREVVDFPDWERHVWLSVAGSRARLRRVRNAWRRRWSLRERLS